ncbi:MFS transporter [Lactiplantibacillus nangangensis]|uniref:MFS transporter n=1 Tax=Lactiplantibacillus nangangensis TaxID=2559917 RepID=A0ABW1SL84_9LACO|nr:MFS transporter [Lactiplantibacillus nangangensis]
MTQLVKNRAFMTLTGADVFETVGMSLFNIALLMYAKTFQQASLLVSIVSVATVLPAPLGIVTGRLADLTGHKRDWLIGTKFVQAGLYLVLAQVIDQRSLVVFGIVIGINMCSDVLGLFSSSLRLPIIQAKVARDDQEQATGLNQGVMVLMETVGQALGVSLLALTHDYQLTGLVNAGTFLLAGLILLSGRRQLSVVVAPASHQSFWVLIKQVKQVLAQSAGINVVGLLLSMGFINAVGASIDAVLNLFLLQKATQLPLSFSLGVWVLNTVFVIGTIGGNLCHTGWFQRFSFRAVELMTLAVLGSIYLDLLTFQNYWVIVVGMGVAGFGMGQMNPQLYANLMKIAAADELGSINGVLSALATISIPVGSVGIVLIYNAISPIAAYGVSLGLLGLSAVSLFLPMSHERGLD